MIPVSPVTLFEVAPQLGGVLSAKRHLNLDVGDSSASQTFWGK